MNKTPASTYKIRFSDCDLFGHLNNARYLDYFLNAREDHLKASYNIDLNEFFQQDLAWLIKSHEIIYLRPAVYLETVRIKSSLIKVTEKMMLVEMVMTDELESQVKAVIWTTFIPISLQTKTLKIHNASFMEFALSIETPGGSGDEQTADRLLKVLAGIK